ncbi:MAG: CBS domain-containing protein, partial [Desulfurivibrionaceae bacterium]
IRAVGSTATIFTQLFREKNIEVDREEATILAMAIYEDTGSFTFSTTTPADLEAMAWLLTKGANLHAVAQFVSQELTAQQVALLNELMHSATTYTIEGIDLVVAKINLPEYVDEFALIVRRFMVMENLNCLFSLAAMGEKTYLIARSRIPEVNVGEIALEFGGGGHASAASATVHDMTLIEAEEKLVRLLHKHVRPASVAGEIMSAPVISVPPEISIKAASRVIDRYNITVLPVIDQAIKEGELKGLISQRVLGKAIYHGLGDLPVSEYMTTDFVVLPPTATLADIQELIIGHRQRFIPIVREGKVLGAITRTDLLSLLVKDPAHLPKHLLEPLNTPSVARQRNLKTLMIENLSREIVVLLRTIGEVAARNGYAAYAVGGFVRDLLLRKHNLDLDIVVEGDGIEFAEELAGRLKGQIRTHEKFNTAVVILPDGFKIDIATARLEYYEYPAAMPTVELSSIKLDLYRRDFTINAMAIHLGPDSFGTLLDFFNCQNDLKDRRIRILHNLSFVEDPTRILRAIRLEQRMGFAIGKHTERLIKNAVKMNLFASITDSRARILKPNSRTRLGYRIFNELKLILSEKEPLPAIKRLGGFQLLKLFHQAMKLDPPLEEILADTQQAVDWYRLLYQDEPFQPWLVFMLALTCRLSSRQLHTLYRRLEIPERYIKLLLNDKAQAERLLRTLERHAAPKPSESYRLMSRLRLESLLFLMGYTKKEETRKAISHFITYQRHVKTEITGADLKELGYTEGPIYGRILERILYARLDNEVDSREEELTFLRGHYPPGRYKTEGRSQARKNQ